MASGCRAEELVVRSTDPGGVWTCVGWAAESRANVPLILSSSSFCALCASAVGFICGRGGCCR